MLAAATTPAAEYDEAEIKAAFVYNLLKFVELSPRVPLGNGTIRLCLLDVPNSSARPLRALNGRVAQGRRVDVADFAPGACHAVVTGEPLGRATLRALSEQGMLTIDGEGFVDQEGMVGLVNVSNRVRFEFNLASARRANIGIASQLLRLAARVIND